MTSNTDILIYWVCTGCKQILKYWCAYSWKRKSLNRSTAPHTNPISHYDPNPHWWDFENTSSQQFTAASVAPKPFKAQLRPVHTWADFHYCRLTPSLWAPFARWVYAANGEYNPNQRVMKKQIAHAFWDFSLNSCNARIHFFLQVILVEFLVIIKFCSPQ